MQCTCIYANCEECGVDLCLKCQKDLVFDKSLQKCICNVKSCLNCSDLDIFVCKKCQNGFKLTNYG